MKLGANSVLFGGYDIESAFRCLSECGYDGIEISAIEGMSEHLVLSRWREDSLRIKALQARYGLALLAMEQPSQDIATMTSALQAASELGIPIVNCGPGGKSGDAESLQQSIDSLGRLADLAHGYGVCLCVKAHVGAAIDNTKTTLALLDAVRSPGLGIDMDPSHIYRSGEDPADSLAEVIGRVRHVHIRDCKGRGPAPGPPELQANGRGDIDLLRYVRVLHESGYSGALDLEVIGAKSYPLERCCLIAAESRGHMQASLQACGAR